MYSFLYASIKVPIDEASIAKATHLKLVVVVLLVMELKLCRYLRYIV
jgi:hypothetical protein